MKRLLLLFSVAAVLLSGCVLVSGEVITGLGKDEWTPVNLPKSLEKQWLVLNYFKGADVCLMDFSAVKGKVGFVSYTQEKFDSGNTKFRIHTSKLYSYTCERKGNEYRLYFNPETTYYFSDIKANSATFRLNGEENPTTTIKVADPPIEYEIVED